MIGTRFKSFPTGVDKLLSFTMFLFLFMGGLIYDLACTGGEDKVMAFKGISKFKCSTVF